LLQQYFFYLHKQHTTALKKIELTDKEIKIIKFLSKQFTSKEIADKMGLSFRTVEGYRFDLQKKLGARNVVGIVIYAIKKDLIKI
jgi:DNA-binding NarL/FixJ family response regulator